MSEARKGTCNDYSERKYIQADGNGEHLNNSVVDGDIVSSAWKHAAAFEYAEAA